MFVLAFLFVLIVALLGPFFTARSRPTANTCVPADEFSMLIYDLAAFILKLIHYRCTYRTITASRLRHTTFPRH